MPRTAEQRERYRKNRQHRQYLDFRDVQAELAHLFRRARERHLTHRAILDKLTTWREHPRYAKLTTYYRTLLSGFQAAEWYRIERECLDWKLTLPDGTWIDAQEYPYSDIDCTSYDMLGAHFWKGTDMIYSDPPMHMHSKYED